MFWQYLNDNNGALAKTVLQTAGVDWRKYQMIDAQAMNLVQITNPNIQGSNN